MSLTTAYLAKLLGAYSLVAGAWLLLRREAALALIDRISNDSVSLSLVGLLRLSIGLAIVIGHDRWDGWVETLVSLLGWIALVRGVSTMFLPIETLREMVVRMRLKENLPLYALVSSLLGAALLLGGFIG
jgi:hypothetical protein